MKKLATLFAALCFAFSFGQTVSKLTPATKSFLSTLNEEESTKVQYAFQDSARTKWTNLPVGMVKRPGLRYGDLMEKSKIEFHEILAAIFSSQGYLKATAIMQLDGILLDIYELAYSKKEIDDKTVEMIRGLNWGYGNYYISIWGNVDDSSTWGLKFEGHHISINVSAVDNSVAVTPLFIGTDPALVKTTEFAGIRILNKEEDYGFELIHMLSDSQKKIATLSQEVPGDIITNPGSEQRLTSYQGIKASEMNSEQQDQLHFLIEEYVNNYERDKSKDILNAIHKSGFENVYFAWIGSYERQKPHYYVINGPDFLIEYDNVGFLKNGNHIHAILREKGNDFGEDLLKEHHKTYNH